MFRSRGKGLATASVAFALTACVGTPTDPIDTADPNPPVGAVVLQFAISPEAGGAGRTVDGSLLIEVPPGAVEEYTELVVRVATAPSSAQARVVGTALDVSPALDFAAPARLSMVRDVLTGTVAGVATRRRDGALVLLPTVSDGAAFSSLMTGTGSYALVDSGVRVSTMLPTERSEKPFDVDVTLTDTVGRRLGTSVHAQWTGSGGVTVDSPSDTLAVQGGRTAVARNRFGCPEDASSQAAWALSATFALDGGAPQSVTLRGRAPCAAAAAPPREATETACLDGLDDDGDGLVDCADPDCRGPWCPESCLPFADADADGLEGCSDPDCHGPACEESCETEGDEDLDGFADCADAVCWTRAASCPEVCDGAHHDEDADGRADCGDPDCFGACRAACVDPRDAGCVEVCDGLGVDDDDDGRIDCADPDCWPTRVCAERCDGAGHDEDGDGLVDCADPSCANSGRCPEACDDGIDNDRDGRIDCGDPDCASDACPETCDDLFDNDDDGATDCEDPDCWGIAGVCPCEDDDECVAEDLWFTEVSRSVGVVHTYQSSDFQSGGGSVFDANGDGLPDLFLMGGGTATPNRLYINQGDGTFVDEAATRGLSGNYFGVGSAVADYDGDGDLDLYVTTSGGGTAGMQYLYRNDGAGVFTDVASAAGVRYAYTRSYGAAFGDYDADGDLDLYVMGFDPTSGSRLFRNEGDGTFSDQSGGLPRGRGTGGFAPRFADMDGDGYPELLLVVDYLHSQYLVNEGDGTFTDATASAGVGLEENGMGQTVADIDGDGDLDWYVSSIDNFVFWTGNKLYLNDGDHRFREVSRARGVDHGAWAWGTVAVDLDLDGRPDLVSTNGFTGTLYVNQPTNVFIQLGDGQFRDVATARGLTHQGQGRGLLRLDYDQDGDEDLVIVSHGEPVTVWRNDLAEPSRHHWLRVTVDARGSDIVPPEGLGAWVSVRVGSRWQHVYLTRGDDFLGGSEPVALFGLGTAEQVDALRVTWPDGSVTEDGPIAADQRVVVTAP